MGGKDRKEEGKVLFERRVSYFVVRLSKEKLLKGVCGGSEENKEEKKVNNIVGYFGSCRGEKSKKLFFWYERENGAWETTRERRRIRIMKQQCRNRRIRKQTKKEKECKNCEKEMQTRKAMNNANEGRGRVRDKNGLNKNNDNNDTNKNTTRIIIKLS
jgi:hypothetical protein